MRKPHRSPARLISSVIISTAITYAAFQVLDRRTVVEIYGTWITPNPATPGHPITITWEAKALRPGCGGEVRRKIIDSTGRVFEFSVVPTVFRENTADGSGRFSREIVLPVEIAPGPASYVARVTRWCGWLQKTLWPMDENGLGSPIRFTIKG